MSKVSKKIIACAATVLVSTLLLAQAQAQAPAVPERALSQNEIAEIMKVANEAEIKAAKVAKSKAENKEVKSFAETMIKAHEENNKDAKKITKSNDIKPKSNSTAKELEKDAKAKITEIKKMKGADFDKAYIDQQVAMHEKLLSDLESSFIPATTNANFKTFLETTKTHVQEHLATAKSIQTSLSK